MRVLEFGNYNLKGSGIEQEKEYSFLISRINRQVVRFDWRSHLTLGEYVQHSQELKGGGVFLPTYYIDRVLIRCPDPFCYD